MVNVTIYSIHGSYGYGFWGCILRTHQHQNIAGIRLDVHSRNLMKPPSVPIGRSGLWIKKNVIKDQNMVHGLWMFMVISELESLIPSIYPSHVSIYTSTMDPSWEWVPSGKLT